MENNSLTFHWDGYDYLIEVAKTKIQEGYRFEVSFPRDMGNLHQVVKFPVYFIIQLPNQNWKSSEYVEERGVEILKAIHDVIINEYINTKEGSILDD